MSVLNSFVNDMFERLALEAKQITRINKKSTMKARDIQSACKLLLHGELAEMTMVEGSTAVDKMANA